MAGLLICEPTKKPESFDSGFLLCPFQKGLQFHFLAQMAQHPLSGNNADEHAPVVHHGGEVHTMEFSSRSVRSMEASSGRLSRL